MDIFVPAIWVAGGISLFAGIQFCIFDLARRQERVFLAFGILCLLLGTYMLFSAQWYQAASVERIAVIARFQMGIVCIVYPVYVWFLSLFTGQRSYRTFLIALSSVFGVLFIVNLWSEYSFLYKSIQPAAAFTLPWGETVTKFHFETSAAILLYYPATYTVFIWSFYRGVVLWKTEKTRAVSILIYVALQLAAVIYGEIIDNYNLNSVYPGELTFLVLIVNVSVLLAQELSARSLALEQSFEDLQNETVRRKIYEHRLDYMAHHDYLTNLPNRRALSQQLKKSVITCSQKRSYGSMLMIDLDHFKMINDSLGHDLGDQLLKMVAIRLLAFQSENSVLIRLGGDEFAVVYDDLPGQGERAEKEAIFRAGKIRDEIIKPYQIAEHKLVIGLSIGIATFTGHDRDFPEIMKHADMALYRAKSSGRNGIEIFAPEMKREADRRLVIDKDLRIAVENQGIDIYFQPQVDCFGEVVGAEVLARWKHPQFGAVPPDKFIAVAEETGLIHSLGEYVLQQSCRCFKNWRDKNLISPGRLSVNVSPWQLNSSGFSNMVIDTLVRNGVDPDMLNLEITESTFLRDLENVSNILNELSDLGVTFSIDDFGTGYSALGFLKNLSLNELKIDKSFIHDMDRKHNEKLIETILAIARHMELRVVAEGVESEQQLKALRRMGCRYYQGYLIGMPLPETEFLQWMNTHITLSMH